MIKSSLVAAALMATVAACDGTTEGDELATETQSVSLPDSSFEIDNDANLLADGPAGSLDWATVEEQRNTDTASGAKDSSFGGGSKEDDACPSVGTGSIPNNKSDLKTFGVYAEAGANLGDPGFLHMFWHRVQDPSGTTLMDFEFNQSAEKCANGVNPVRTAGDLLIEYRLENGGSVAALKLREWSGSAWGAARELGEDEATGTVNSTSIPSASSDGLGTVSPRTFGEASISLASIFRSDKCTTFGSAFVKSRSSDSFTSALKDYIAPIGVDITNCGKVIIRKQTEPASDASIKFGFATTLVTDPASDSTFSLGHGEAKEYGNVLFGNGYTVTEELAAGYELEDINCDASSEGVTPVIDLATRKVTFSVTKDTDIVDCTFTNQAKGKVIIEKISTDGTGTFNFTSTKLGNFALQTTVAGVGVEQAFDDLAPGTYAVSESVPAGWVLAGATCSDGSPISAISVDAGETVKCTFTNARVRGAIRIIKTRYHAANGFMLPQPHEGVTFTVSGGSLGSAATSTTNANGIACIDNLLLSDYAGDYSVTEAVPAGYVAEGALTKTVSVVAGGTCATDFAPVAFHNLPLTNLTVSVDSQIPGGTLSTITCGAATVNTPASGDGSLTLSNLTAGTYTCTVVIKH